MIKVVYDIDDVLNNLNDVVMGELGIERWRVKQFRIRDNKDLTQEEIDRIQAHYANPDVFARTTICPSIKHILDIETINPEVAVFIHSLSYSEKIKQVKERQLAQAIPEMRHDRILLEVGGDKAVLDDIHILVEDSYINCVDSKAKMFNALVNRPHNQAENYGRRDEDHKILRLPNTESAIYYIQGILTPKIYWSR